MKKTYGSLGMYSLEIPWKVSPMDKGKTTVISEYPKQNLIL